MRNGAILICAAILAISCPPAEAASLLGNGCSASGTTKLDNDHKNIVTCIGGKWKAMTSNDVTCPEGQVLKGLSNGAAVCASFDATCPAGSSVREIADGAPVCLTPCERTSTSCTKTITTTYNKANPYGALVRVCYDVAGGAGGGGGGGGGGGSSAVLVNNVVAASADGGDGFQPGKRSSGMFILPAGAAMTAYVGGGGGTGDCSGGGGGAGFHSGTATGGCVECGSGYGKGGSGTTGGLLPVGGNGGSGICTCWSNGGRGGNGLSGGAPCSAPMCNGGGNGGGGFGSGGGGIALSNYPVGPYYCQGFVGAAGGSSGGNGAISPYQGNGTPSAVSYPAALGANNWAAATTLPTEAGARPPSNYSGGNAGLIILTYDPPDGVCSF